MYAYLKTINSDVGNNTPLRKVRQRIGDVKKLNKVVNSPKQSKQPIQRGRLLILGDRDAGKTSTKKSLMGENFDDTVDKTYGVDICSVDNRWKEITQPKTTSAPAVEAKMVAESALKDRAEMQKKCLTTHDIYRKKAFQPFFQILEPFIGSSACAKSLVFYLVLLVLVAVIRVCFSVSGLCLVAAADALVFVGLEVQREVKMKSFDSRVWRNGLYGFCVIGAGIGNLLTVLIQTSIIPRAPYLPAVFYELFECVLLLVTAELLMLSKLLMIKLPGSLRNALDVMDIPADSAKIVHFCVIGTAFKFCFSTPSFNLWYCCLLLIWALQVKYLAQVMFFNWFSKLFLVLELCFAIFVFFSVKTAKLVFIIFFVLLELVSHGVASCHYLQMMYHRHNVSLFYFIIELLSPSHSLSLANQLLANPIQLKKEIEAIRSMKIQLLDFAGDKDYYCYHHIFLAHVNAIYLIVFDWKKEMEESIVKSIWFWLESIAMKSREPNCVFLVATHCFGKEEKDYQKFDKLLKSNIYRLFANKIVQNTEHSLMFFPVENKNGPQDDGVCVLRKKIVNIANKMFNKQVQLHCFKLEDKIADLRKRNKADELCMSVEEFQSLMESCEVGDAQNEQVMDYLFNQGVILYTRGANGEQPSWLLLEPMLLVDIIIKLVTYPGCSNKQEPYLRGDWNILKEDGFVTLELLSHLLSPFGDRDHVMRSFLEAFNIICSVENTLVAKEFHVNSDHMLTHFVPAMLPDAPPENQHLHSSHGLKTFYIFFIRFLPEAVFYSLVAHAFKHSILSCPDDKPEVHKDWGLFYLAGRENSQKCYELLLQKDKGVIEVKFSNSDPSGLSPADVLLHMAEMMNTVCNRSFQHLDFHCGPACPNPKCPGDKYPPHCHLNYHRLKPRPHVFNVYPRCKKKRHVVSFNCRHSSFKKELKEWDPRRK